LQETEPAPSIFIGWQKHSVRAPFGPGNLLVVSGETGKLGTYEKNGVVWVKPGLDLEINTMAIC